MLGIHPIDIAAANAHANLVHTFNMKFLNERCESKGLDEQYGWEIYSYEINIPEEHITFQCEIKVSNLGYKVNIKFIQHDPVGDQPSKVISTTKCQVDLMELMSEEIYSQCTKMARTVRQ